MICPNCNTPGQGNYCAHCGHQMFSGHCKHCRKEVFGNFCAHCGTLFSPHGFIVAIKALISHIPLRTQIRQAFANPVHAQRFLDRLDLSFKSVKDFEVKTLEEITAPIQKELGITGTLTKHQVMDGTAVEVVANILLVLAKNAYSIDAVRGGSNGFLITAIVPYDLPIWGGNLLFLVETLDEGVKLSVDAKIRGEAYTLEQSKTLIKRMLSEIEAVEVQGV